MDRYQNKYRIASARLQKWDYGWNAAYFVTICTHNRQCYFGKIESGIMIYSKLGSIASTLWTKIPEHFQFVELSEFVIMPDHVHGIIIINKSYDNCKTVETQNFPSLHSPPTLPSSPPTSPSSPPTLPSSPIVPLAPWSMIESPFQSKNHFGPQSQNLASIIRGFKTGVTKCAHEIGKGFKWQPRYHEHIIRDDFEYRRIVDYIRQNPQKW